MTPSHQTHFHRPFIFTKHTQTQLTQKLLVRIAILQHFQKNDRLVTYRKQGGILFEN